MCSNIRTSLCLLFCDKASQSQFIKYKPKIHKILINTLFSYFIVIGM